MNKHHRSSLILIILTIVPIVLSYWLDVNLGYGFILYILTVGYTIYLNYKAIREGKIQQKTE